MNLTDKYGLREVSNVVIYTIGLDGQKEKPVLFLDTLKMSNMNISAENTFASGGKGNAQLIGWDYNRDIEIDIQDALFSEKSLRVMLGSPLQQQLNLPTTQILKLIKPESIIEILPDDRIRFKENQNEFIAQRVIYFDDQGHRLLNTTLTIPKNTAFIGGFIDISSTPIKIGHSNFPGTYYLEGYTTMRRTVNGQDTNCLITIPKFKILSDQTITLESEGDPAVFSFKGKALYTKNQPIVSFSFENSFSPTDPIDLDRDRLDSTAELI